MNAVFACVRRTAPPALFLWLVVALVGCPTCPEISIFDSEAGLILVEEEHLDGWGQEECRNCHSMPALHRRGCSEGVNMTELREHVLEGGIEICAECHGDNGVDTDNDEEQGE